MKRLALLILLAGCWRTKIVKEVVTLEKRVPCLTDTPTPVDVVLPDPARSCWAGRPVQAFVDRLFGFEEEVCLTPRAAMTISGNLDRLHDWGKQVDILCRSDPSLLAPDFH